MKYYNILHILLTFYSCNSITLSEKELNDISNLKVEVLIEDDIKQNSLNKINVFLSNREKNIINENIQILLNGKPLELLVRTGNYYDKHPLYKTDNLERNESYYFEIILPDSIKYPIAYIKPKELTSEFNFTETISINQDFVIDWENNNVLANLEIWKLVHQKNNPNMHSGGRYAESTIHHIISTQNGTYKVPKLFYIDSLTIADYLNIRISSIENGLINPDLLKSSIVSYNYVIEKSINIED